MLWTGWTAMMIQAAAPAIAPADRAAILDAARRPVAEELGRPPLFVVKTLRRDGDWAFLFADMQAAGGKPFDYAGTKKAEAARRGLVSHAYAALLRRQNGRWQVVEAAIGLTDVAWEGWAAKHGAPPSVFAFD
jgi:hypothetical protein